MKTEKQISLAAAEFAERWKGRGYERGESQPFWIDLLSNVYGIETPSDGFITFEDHRMVDASNFIDGRIRSTKVLIEQKSLGKDLRAGIRQSDNESNVHMAWMRAVCGRLKSDYRYSKDVVYNNFPWPNPTEEQKAKIEQTAQAILDARTLYPDSSLADLYDELTMPVELRKAHQENDRAVMQAYGFPIKTMTESQCVAELFKLYQKLTK